MINDPLVRLSEGFCPVSTHGKLIVPLPTFCPKCHVAWQLEPHVHGLSANGKLLQGKQIISAVELLNRVDGSDWLLQQTAHYVNHTLARIDPDKTSPANLAQKDDHIL